MKSASLQPITLINSLLRPELYQPKVKECRLIETHISWVILAGQFAYKIKKSINLGFLDFSSLEKRLFYCNEELRLNKRLAPSIYLEVLPITGTVECPQWSGEGEAIEYAVKMRAFSQQAQLDRVLVGGGLLPEQIDILAKHIAGFHQQTEVAGTGSPYGEPEAILNPIEENFKQIRQHFTKEKAVEILTELEDWSRRNFAALQPAFLARKSACFVRECHGDMHLRNIAWVDDAPLVFDCIDFNPFLRWIDVMSDVAFLVMDLMDRKQTVLAQRFLNDYLEQTGDYGGMGVLRFYLVYRAMVRAKIDAIRAAQEGIGRKEQLTAEQDFFSYLELASSYIKPARPSLIITRGLSASGKSTVSRSLLERIGAVRIRSDVERKRLFGLAAGDHGGSAVAKHIYSWQATERTYGKLAELAGKILDAGYPVIVDAVFLQQGERQCFQTLAKSRRIPFMILECRAGLELLRRRIGQRRNDVSDADLQVLEKQITLWQPLQESEQKYALSIDTGEEIDINALARQVTLRTSCCNTTRIP